MSGVRPRKAGGHADYRLPVFLSMRELQDDAASEAGELLRVLFLRVGEVPADTDSWLLWIDQKEDGARRICGVG